MVTSFYIKGFLIGGIGIISGFFILGIVFLVLHFTTKDISIKEMLGISDRSMSLYKIFKLDFFEGFKNFSILLILIIWALSILDLSFLLVALIYDTVSELMKGNTGIGKILLLGGIVFLFVFIKLYSLIKEKTLMKKYLPVSSLPLSREQFDFSSKMILKHIVILENELRILTSTADKEMLKPALFRDSRKMMKAMQEVKEKKNLLSELNDIYNKLDTEELFDFDLQKLNELLKNKGKLSFILYR